jgi:hypothetical protein
MKPWKAIASAVPAPVALWADRWLDLFSSTHLAYPEWQIDAQNTALAIGTPVALIICFALSHWSRTRLTALALAGLFVTLLSLVGCWLIWFYLGKAMPASDAIFWQDLWKGLYIFAMISLLTTISVGALSVKVKTNKAFWIIVALVLAVAIIVISYVLWHRHERSGPVGAELVFFKAMRMRHMSAAQVSEMGGAFHEA